MVKIALPLWGTRVQSLDRELRSHKHRKVSSPVDWEEMGQKMRAEEAEPGKKGKKRKGREGT